MKRGKAAAREEAELGMERGRGLLLVYR